MGLGIQFISTVQYSWFVCLCSEESTAVPGVGVDKLVEVGKLDHIKNGPIFWVDSADSQPCMGRLVCPCVPTCVEPSPLRYCLLLHVDSWTPLPFWSPSQRCQHCWDGNGCCHLHTREVLQRIPSSKLDGHHFIGHTLFVFTIACWGGAIQVCHTLYVEANAGQLLWRVH